LLSSRQILHSSGGLRNNISLESGCIRFSTTARQMTPWSTGKISHYFVKSNYSCAMLLWCNWASNGIAFSYITVLQWYDVHVLLSISIDFLLLLGPTLNIASALFNWTINGLHLHGLALCFIFSVTKNDRRNFICIALRDVFVSIKEKGFASSVRSCTVYGPCIPRALSKALGYPKFKVFVHNVLWALEIPFMKEDRNIRENMTLWSD